MCVSHADQVRITTGQHGLKLVLIQVGVEPDAIVAPNGARFARDDAILPGILEAFAARREAAKQRGDRTPTSRSRS